VLRVSSFEIAGRHLVRHEGIDLRGPEFPVYRRSEGAHVFQAHQVERERFRSERTAAARSEQQPRMGVSTSPSPEVSPVITMVFIIDIENGLVSGVAGMRSD
jgi:hypothetical protein